MNTNTGDIYRDSKLEAAIAEERQRDRGTAGRRASTGSVGPRTAFKPIDPANLTPRARRQLDATGQTKISRNSPCPCGSRKRFKRCCMTA